MVTLADPEIAPAHAPDGRGSSRGSFAGGEWVSHPVGTFLLRAVVVVEARRS